MSTILRDSHNHILNSLPDFIRDEYVFSGGTALAEYYFQHRLSDDLDFFCRKKEATIAMDALQNVLSSIGKTTYERTHGRVIFGTESCGEIIKIDFCPLYCNRLNEPQYEKHGFLVDSLDDIAANKILALCGRTEPKDFIDIYFFNKLYGYDIQKMVGLAEKKERQAYQYLLSLERAEKMVFDRDIYKIIIDFSESELKYYFSQQNKILKPSALFELEEDENQVEGNG